AWLRALDAEHGYALVVPAAEFSLYVFTHLPEDDALRRRAVLPGNAALQIALEKQRTLAHAERLGLRAPQTRLIASSGDAAPPERYPVVLKAVRSQTPVAGGLRYFPAALARNAGERAAHLDAMLPFTPVLQQE